MFNNDFQVYSDREWIMTNNSGGYSLGFGHMVNKRKYNGLLVASSEQLRRIHILSSLEERVEDGSTFFYLDANHYSNCIYPNGYSHMVKSWLRPYPCFLYSSSPFNSRYFIFKEIFLSKRQNAVVVKYTNLGEKSFSLILRPKLTLRDHHTVNYPGTWDGVKLENKVNTKTFSMKRVDNGFEAHGYLSEGQIVDDQVIYRSVFYPVEALRGYDATEDVLSPVRLNTFLMPGTSVSLLISSEPIMNQMRIVKSAQDYYYSLPLPENHPKNELPGTIMNTRSERKHVFDWNGYYKLLELATAEFIVNDSDVVAGYPWFGAWGRDTMIFLSSLNYLDGGPKNAVEILKKYGAKIRNGLLPNTFGEGGEGLNYDSVDAPLWYVLRCYEFSPESSELFKNCENIILNYLYQDTNPFFVDDDGLVEIRQSDHAMTWMDAKVYNNPVTPRWGKPVEINALWFNALCALREMSKKQNVTELNFNSFKLSKRDLDGLCEKVKSSLQKFVGGEYLADRIENGNPVWEIRPNAVIGLSLPFDFVDVDVMKRVWTMAREKLYTPYGLRSLQPDHPSFKRKYVGNQKQRDLAYHQGTVWSFLLLPFVKLTWKKMQDEASVDEIIREVTGYIWTIRDSVMKGEMSSVAEVWDAVDPYFPKGCPAQAWSVGALFEIENLLLKWRNNK